VDRFSILGPAEDVDHWELVVTPALDGVVDLRYRELDRLVDVGKLAFVDIDDARAPVAVAVAAMAAASAVGRSSSPSSVPKSPRAL